MDLFTYYTQYRVLVCKPCGYAVPPAHLESHISKNHPHDACRAAGVDPVHSRARKSAALLAGCPKKYMTPLILLQLRSQPHLRQIRLHRLLNSIAYAYVYGHCGAIIARPLHEVCALLSITAITQPRGKNLFMKRFQSIRDGDPACTALTRTIWSSYNTVRLQ
jgi:hypothetical protein